MSQLLEVKVPDIGDFKDVPVIEVAVKAGDAVQAEDTLIVLESDKATMDVPAPTAGTVKEIRIKVGDKVAEGSLILLLLLWVALRRPDGRPLNALGDSLQQAARQDAERLERELRTEVQDSARGTRQELAGTMSLPAIPPVTLIGDQVAGVLAT